MVKLSAKALITDRIGVAPERGPKRRKCTCRYLWNTELHGLTAFLTSRTVAERTVWAVIIGACLLMSVVTTEWMFDDYLERQTATLITFEQKQRGDGNRGLKLPVVVLCPKNPDSLKYHLVLRDIAKRIPRLDRATIGRLISFAVAGAGFTNMVHFMGRRRMPNISSVETQRLNSLFRRWRGGRTLAQFYEQLFEQYGYECSDFLDKCFYGYQQIPCCDVFIPYYVMLRGRCMRLNKTFYQMDPADIGRLDVYMKQMPSRLIEADGWQPQIVVYLTDESHAVGVFPRYYVHFRAAVMLRARARNISMLPGNSQCQDHPEFHGRSSCWLRRWLWEKVIEPYNCSVFYLGRKHYWDYDICEPSTIVDNYQSIIDLKLDNDTRKRCLPACNRSEHLFEEFRPRATILYKVNKIPDFRFEVSFTNLELEVYQEVLTTTLPGFVSQLGGQSGLFVGLSLCTIIQILISALCKCQRWADACLGKWEQREQQKGRAQMEEMAADIVVHEETQEPLIPTNLCCLNK